MSPWNNESDNRISYTIFGSVAGSAGFFSICGVAISYFKCRRRRIAYLVLKKSADYHVPKITLANYTRALESPVNHHTQAIEDTQKAESFTFVKFNSANIQFTSAGKRYAKLTNISTCPDSVVSSFASSNATDLRDFSKCSLITNENLTLELVHESHTQTITNNLECKKTIFGTPFDGTFMLDETNRTLQMHYSDAAMTLPLGMTKAGQVEVSASTFRSIEATREKLGLSDDEIIASPVVEYAINGSRKLDGYAFVRLPFVGKSTNLKVKKFESDEGLETVAKSHEIPRKDKQNEDLDTYYIVDRSAVLIYTKSFSGFYCTMCGHTRDLELIAFIFGSYKCLNNMYEVFITAYIADVLLKIEDYRKEMFENEENRQGRKCLRSEIPLGMPDDCDLVGNDYIEACLFLKTDEDKRKWKHVIHPERGTPVYPPKQKIKLATIAQNCQRCLQIHTRRNTRSVQKNWYLSNNENTVPSDKFQCYIDLTVCKKDTEIFEPNCITIDELELRETDRSRIKDSFPVQETSSLTGACAARLSRKSSRNVGTEGDIQLSSPQSHTLVRAESEQDLMRNSSVGNGRRHIPPSPELSQAYGTTGFPAIPNIDSPEPDD
ncbi:uncharacterized protein LOC128546674 [Mercenaria mercenaria]|uniref:uncharacterized protein LOC128546674 n=1 Tax=Mercenaria mercenaria TaxID=6596 RepID=UPI00234F84F3|nr:uncharacterized protein LOC128546674 [Mercenaria mercenaria]